MAMGSELHSCSSHESSTLMDVLSPGNGGKTAVIVPDGGPALTYPALKERVASLADILRRGGIRAGDVVSIALPNGLEYLTTCLAVTWARAIAAPLNPSYKVEEFRLSMQATKPQAAIVSPGQHALREAASSLNVPIWETDLDVKGSVRLSHARGVSASTSDDPPEPDDIALFLHTGGTTSRPKVVPLTHRNLMASLRVIVGTYKITPDDTSLIVMPLYHVHGLLGATLSTLTSGGTVVLPPRFSASNVWRHVIRYGVNWYSATPTIHQILLTRADDDRAQCGTLRFIRSCSSALTPALLQRLEGRLGAPVLEAYGMTEASHQVSSNPLPPGIRKPGTVGIKTGVDIAILDEEGNALPKGRRGEVSLRGPNITRGYHNNPEANASTFTNGWFRTGDQGFLDEEGYLTLTGRIRELINRGGQKISPLEVDAVLLEHSAVAAAACFSVPDEKYGEEIHAAVVLNGDATEEELIAFCRERLADFKVPKRLYTAGALPRTATGKINREQVAALFHE